MLHTRTHSIWRMRESVSALFHSTKPIRRAVCVCVCANECLIACVCVCVCASVRGAIHEIFQCSFECPSERLVWHSSSRVVRPLSLAVCVLQQYPFLCTRNTHSHTHTARTQTSCCCTPFLTVVPCTPLSSLLCCYRALIDTLNAQACTIGNYTHAETQKCARSTPRIIELVARGAQRTDGQQQRIRRRTAAELGVLCIAAHIHTNTCASAHKHRNNSSSSSIHANWLQVLNERARTRIFQVHSPLLPLFAVAVRERVSVCVCVSVCMRVCVFVCARRFWVQQPIHKVVAH